MLNSIIFSILFLSNPVFAGETSKEVRFSCTQMPGETELILKNFVFTFFESQDGRDKRVKVNPIIIDTATGTAVGIHLGQNQPSNQVSINNSIDGEAQKNEYDAAANNQSFGIALKRSSKTEFSGAFRQGNYHFRVRCTREIALVHHD